MKKSIVIIALVAIIALTGCGPKYRLYSVALLDRYPQTAYGMMEIADTFRVHSVSVVEEDGIEAVLGEREFFAQQMKLCASYRRERLDNAVTLGKELGVDAVIFSSLPPVGLKTVPRPCPAENLISFFIIDPPMVLFEVTNYDDFLYNMTVIDWEEVVKPPPEPEDFTVALDEEIEYAGLKIRIERNDGQYDSDVATTKQSDDLGNDSENDEIERQSESRKTSERTVEFEDESETEQMSRNAPEIESANIGFESDDVDTVKSDEKPGGEAEKAETAPWLFVVEKDYHIILSTAFESQIADEIKGKLRYDVTATGTGEAPEFVLILTDLRID